MDKDLPIPVDHGFWMNVSPNDYATYGIYFFGNYDPEMTSVVKHLVKPGDHVWDVGTERGWFTLLMASIVGMNGKVDSFEAFPPTVEKLKNNVELNKFSNVRINSAGVSEKKGKMWFVPPSDTVTSNISFLENCNGVGYLTEDFQEGALEIPTLSLDDYYREHVKGRVSFIKMDIEGAELSALKGAIEMLKKDRPVLGIEFNRQTAIRAGNSVEEVYAFLQALGYKFYYFYDKFFEFNLGDHPDKDLVINVYCFPKEL